MNELNKKYYHIVLGQWGIFTEACEYLQNDNCDRTSIYLEFDGEIKEVTKSLLREQEGA